MCKTTIKRLPYDLYQVVSFVQRDSNLNVLNHSLIPANDRIIKSDLLNIKLVKSPYERIFVSHELIYRTKIFFIKMFFNYA